MHDYVDVNHQQTQEELVKVTHDDAKEPIQENNKLPQPTEDGEIAPDENTSAEQSPTPIIDEAASCVCCALKLIFIHYEHSDASIIPPDSLRYALSLLLDNDGSRRFALNEMSDAEEALAEILTYLHFDDIGGESALPPSSSKFGSAHEESELSRSLDVPCVPSCISHRVFGHELMDQKICTQTKCRATSDPDINPSFMYRIYVTEIVQVHRQHRQMRLEHILKANYLSQNYSCPSPNKQTRGPRGEVIPATCSGPAKIERWILSMPEVFTMMCVWSGEIQDRKEIQEFFEVIPRELHLDEFLRVQADASQAARTTSAYRLRGMVCFYGRHYVAIFYSSQSQSFIMFDDRRVTHLGDWSAVVDRCCRGKLQPTVLFYEACDPVVYERLKADIASSDAEAEAARREEEKIAATSGGSHMPLDEGTGGWHPTPLPARPNNTTTSSKSASSSTSSNVDILSPASVATQQYFGTHSAHSAAAHIIPAPVEVNNSSSSSTVNPHPTRLPPGIISDYIPHAASSSSDQDEYNKWFHGTDLNGSNANSSASLARPSLARATSSGSTRLWICLSCNKMYSTATTPHGQCPTCIERVQAAANDRLRSGELFRLR